MRAGGALDLQGRAGDRERDFVTELTDEAIAVHLRYGPEVPTMHLSTR